MLQWGFLGFFPPPSAFLRPFVAAGVGRFIAGGGGRCPSAAAPAPPLRAGRTAAARSPGRSPVGSRPAGRLLTVLFPHLNTTSPPRSRRAPGTVPSSSRGLPRLAFPFV